MALSAAKTPGGGLVDDQHGDADALGVLGGQGVAAATSRMSLLVAI